MPVTDADDWLWGAHKYDPTASFTLDNYENPTDFIRWEGTLAKPTIAQLDAAFDADPPSNVLNWPVFRQWFSTYSLYLRLAAVAPAQANYLALQSIAYEPPNPSVLLTFNMLITAAIAAGADPVSELERTTTDAKFAENGIGWKFNTDASALEEIVGYKYLTE